ncbi:MAG: hypothetical protein A2735_01820 [Candidatus Yanofskybacteria bacterium RIFCSPHIGHO2_01_FULL_41_21]|uniref:Uncharacterized protein n=2 Tax=Candidatus Yanofskyibacteriota TaxID=1752733 RepID=A0A0G0ZKY4_9BACT|nr:MAG: hypothetical protein UU70_C0012G0003 [Candidatus Yanofskybacteria bacterium GW2011_GWA1_41_6]OGM97450.1 MAG: hypothetical protein A2735_01820 [Candidatus Yanofskybacteria bacterium RIFCSPHIGHO2_01_FULL_41_21]
MSTDSFFLLDEIDMEAIQIFCEEENRIRALCRLTDAMALFYKKGSLKHNDRPTQLKNVIRSNIRELERRFGWKISDIIEILAVIEEIVSNLGNPNKVSASSISVRAREILREEYKECLSNVNSLPWYSQIVLKVTRNRSSVPFLKKFRFED